jgi:hypothetical protein
VVNIKKINGFLSKHYDKFNILSNVLIALGVVGFSVLGLFTNVMTISAIIFWGAWIAGLYFIGKYLDGQLEDIPDLSKSNVSGSDKTFCRNPHEGDESG